MDHGAVNAPIFVSGRRESCQRLHLIIGWRTGPGKSGALDPLGNRRLGAVAFLRRRLANAVAAPSVAHPSLKWKRGDNAVDGFVPVCFQASQTIDRADSDSASRGISRGPAFFSLLFLHLPGGLLSGSDPVMKWDDCVDRP